MAQVKEQNRTPEKELSDAEFKTLVVRMFKGLNEYGKSTREEMKAIQREIKKNPQETSSEGKNARIQINDLEHKEEINIPPEQNEETKIIEWEDSSNHKFS